MPVDATVETFGELTREGSVLVDFWGPRCQPCLAMMPMVAELERLTGDVGKADLERAFATLGGGEAA